MDQLLLYTCVNAVLLLVLTVMCLSSMSDLRLTTIPLGWVTYDATHAYQAYVKHENPREALEAAGCWEEEIGTSPFCNCMDSVTTGAGVGVDASVKYCFANAHSTRRITLPRWDALTVNAPLMVIMWNTVACAYATTCYLMTNNLKISGWTWGWYVLYVLPLMIFPFVHNNTWNTVMCTLLVVCYTFLCVLQTRASKPSVSWCFYTSPLFWMMYSVGIASITLMALSYYQQREVGVNIVLLLVCGSATTLLLAHDCHFAVAKTTKDDGASRFSSCSVWDYTSMRQSHPVKPAYPMSSGAFYAEPRVDPPRPPVAPHPSSTSATYPINVWRLGFLLVAGTTYWSCHQTGLNQDAQTHAMTWCVYLAGRLMLLLVAMEHPLLRCSDHYDQCMRRAQLETVVRALVTSEVLFELGFMRTSNDMRLTK
jgi:hypothetical protein